MPTFNTVRPRMRWNRLCPELLVRRSSQSDSSNAEACQGDLDAEKTRFLTACLFDRTFDSLFLPGAPNVELSLHPREGTPDQ